VGNDPQLKLYLDHDISYKLAHRLRQCGYDAIGAWEVGQAHFSDVEQLEYAVGQKRAIVTCNADDFVPLYLEWWNAERHHYGIITSQQLEFGEMLRRLSRLLEAITADDMRDMLRNLAEFKEST